MKKFKSSLNAALFLGLMFGCAKSTTDLAPGMSSLTFQGTRPNSLTWSRGISSLQAGAEAASLTVLNQDGSTAGTLTLTDARLALKEIKIKLAEESEGEDNIKFHGPYVVDLLANSITPELEPIQLSAGSYRRLEMKLHKVTGNEENSKFGSAVPESDSLHGNSIYLEGTYTGETAAGAVTNMPFSLSLDVDEEFRVDGGSQSLSISATEPNPIVIAFRLAKWVMFNDPDINDNEVDFAEVVPVDGQIQLSDESSGANEKIWQVFRDAIKMSADFGKDEDDDGVLESEEDDDEESEDEAD